MARHYVSYYIQSSGQPVSGEEQHTSKKAAIARARMLRDALYLRSGGKAEAQAEDGEILYQWLEHAEGGYRSI